MTTREHEIATRLLRSRITRLTNQARQQPMLIKKLDLLQRARIIRTALNLHLTTFYNCSES